MSISEFIIYFIRALRDALSNISFRVLATTDFNINKKSNRIPGDKKIFLLVLYITKYRCKIR